MLHAARKLGTFLTILKFTRSPGVSLNVLDSTQPSTGGRGVSAHLRRWNRDFFLPLLLKGAVMAVAAG